jgi:hypothetical protein
MQLRDNYKVQYIDTATTTQVDTGQGQLIAIVVGETAAGAISIIDNTSGSTVNIGTLKASVVEGTYWFLAQYAVGLRIITAGASKITVIYNNIG